VESKDTDLNRVQILDISLIKLLQLH